MSATPRDATRVLTDLSATLIEPRLFPTRRWFAATPLWYYHAPREGDARPPEESLEALVDPDLREACRIVIAAGLRTTPSCQGHFYPRPLFEEIWRDLVREAALIRGPGLAVVDSESGETYLFRSDRYRLPWDDFSAFHEEVSSGQARGYLGVVVPPERADLAGRLERVAFARNGARLARDGALEPAAAGGGALFVATVEAGSIGERRRAWAHLTERLREALAPDEAPPRGPAVARLARTPKSRRRRAPARGSRFSARRAARRAARGRVPRRRSAP